MGVLQNHKPTEAIGLRFVVVRGQRATLAAVEVASIPAMVGASQQDADRIVDQLAENEHRSAMTAGERIEALATLSGLGLTAAQIAKKTATKRSRRARRGDLRDGHGGRQRGPRPDP